MRPGFRELCDGDAEGDAAILRLQDEGRAVEAWTAAGWDVTFGSPRTAPEEQRRLGQWLSSLPVHLPGLAQRVRDTLPAAERGGDPLRQWSARPVGVQWRRAASRRGRRAASARRRGVARNR